MSTRLPLSWRFLVAGIAAGEALGVQCCDNGDVQALWSGGKREVSGSGCDIVRGGGAGTTARGGGGGSGQVAAYSLIAHQLDIWTMSYNFLSRSDFKSETSCGFLIKNYTGSAIIPPWGCIPVPPPVTFSLPSRLRPQERAKEQTQGLSCPLLWSLGSH